MGSQDVIIKETFEIGSRPYKFTLFRHQLTWWPVKRGGEDLSELVNLKILDIFSAELLGKPSDENSNKSTTGCCTTPFNENSLCETLVVHFAQKKENSDNWKPNKLKISHTDFDVLNTWLSLLQLGINDLKHRPKNLLFFINPFGGKRKALKIFEQKVKPILEICKVKYNVINTQRRNHATEALTSMSPEKLSEYHVVVAVGGDGTVTEVVTGLLMRGMSSSSSPTLKEMAPSKVPIAVIPAGSSNALAYTVHGTGDATTATVHLVLGGSIPLDVGAVQNNNGISRFVVGQLSYGHLADTLQHSEKLRWMGPKRYDFAGLKKFLGHASYQGSIDIKLAAEDYTAPTICGGGNGCEDCSNHEMTEGSGKPGEWRRVEGQFLGISGANISCRCALSPHGMAPFAHLCSGSLDLILLRKASRLGHLRYLLRTAGDSRRAFALPFVERYRVEEFVFTPMQCCDSTPAVTPDSTSRSVDQLMDVTGSVNSMATCGCDSRTQEKTHSVWNCDGELFLQPNVRVTVHKNLIRIMCRNQPNISQQQCNFPSDGRNNSGPSSPAPWSSQNCKRSS